MKLRSTLMIAFAVAAPMLTGLALNINSQAFANEPQEQTEFQKRRGRWQALSSEERAVKRAEKAAKMRELLGLSDVQADEIEAIREKFRLEKEALRQEAQALRENSDREGMRELRSKMRILRQEMNDEIEEVLTAEQRQKLQDFRAQRQGRRSGQRSVN